MIVQSCLPDTGDFSRHITVETICSKQCRSLLLWRSPWRQETKRATLPLPKVIRFYGTILQITSLVSCDPGRVCNKVATADRPCRRSNTLRLSITTWWLLGNALSPILTCSSIVAIKFLVENELKYEIYNHTHTVQSCLVRL